MKTQAKMNNCKLEPWCIKQMVKHAIKSHHLMWEQIQNLELEDRNGDCHQNTDFNIMTSSHKKRQKAQLMKDQKLSHKTQMKNPFRLQI